MKTVPLGQLCDVQIGKTPKRAEQRYWSGGQHDWLSIKDMDQGRSLCRTAEQITQSAVDELNCRLVEPGTVLLSFKLSIGKVGIAAAPLYTNEAIAHLPIVDPSLDRDFLYWALKTIPLTGGADRAAMGSTLNKSKLKQLKIPLPPIEEQRRIAAVLDAADDLRTKRRQALAKLDTLTQAIFIDMFGDPVTNPFGWRKVPLSKLLDRIDSGKSPVCEPERPSDGQWGVLKAGAVTYCEYDPDAVKTLPKDVPPHSHSEVKVGDVLFARKNTHALVAACAYVRSTPDRRLLSDLIFRLVIDEDVELDPQYLQQVLVSSRQRREVQKLAGGAAGSMPNISKSKLMGVEIPVPDIQTQLIFGERVDKVLVGRDKLQGSGAELDTLFASLQQRAFAGEL